MTNHWEKDVDELLTEIMQVQDDALAVLAQKRECLRRFDLQGLNATDGRDEELLGKLQSCIRRREDLLAKAKEEKLPSNNIRTLAKAIPSSRRDELNQRIAVSQSRARLLQHQSMTNWLIIQKTLIHLSQMLEIIATGGRLQPTYCEGEPVNSSGGLVDQAA